MRVLFDNNTDDITLFLTEENYREIEPSESHTPSICAETGNHGFNLMVVKRDYYITVRDPRVDRCTIFWTAINKDAYRDLYNNRRISDRYGMSSKVNVIMEDFID